MKTFRIELHIAPGADCTRVTFDNVGAPTEHDAERWGEKAAIHIGCQLERPVVVTEGATVVTIDQMAADVFRKMPSDAPWQQMSVRQVFKACSGSALTIERIELIISAIHGIGNNVVPGLRDALNDLKSLGILRNRRAQGETLWEVNY